MLGFRVEGREPHVGDMIDTSEDWMEGRKGALIGDLTETQQAVTMGNRCTVVV